MPGRAVAVVVVLLLAVIACSEGAGTPAPSPSPSPTGAASPAPVSGLRMAVVLPPPSLTTPEEVEALRDDVEQLRRRHRDDVAVIRVVQPDAPAFTADVVALVAEDGADLVCAVGAQGDAAVTSVAASFPGTAFCATPADADADAEDVPPNVLLVDVRVEEVAYLAGVAAQLAGGDGVPGFVAGEPQYAVDRRRAAFAAGAEAAGGEPARPYVGLTRGEPERAVEHATAQYAAGVTTIYAAAGAGDTGVLAAAEDHGGLVIGSRHTLIDDPETPSAAVLLTVSVRLDVALDVAVTQALGTWGGGRASVGIAEEVFVLAAGGSGAYPPVAAAVEEARRRISAGELDPLPTG